MNIREFYLIHCTMFVENYLEYFRRLRLRNKFKN